MIVMAPILLILSVSLIGVIVKVANDRHRRCKFQEVSQTKPVSVALTINGHEYQFPHVMDKTERLKLAVQFCSAQGTIDYDTNLVNNINSIFNELNSTQSYEGSTLGFTVETFATCANNVADQLEFKMCSCEIPVADDNPLEVTTISNAPERDVIFNSKQIYDDIDRIEFLDVPGGRTVVAISPDNYNLEEVRLSEEAEVIELKEIKEKREWGDAVGIPNKLRNTREVPVIDGIEKKVADDDRTVIGDADGVEEELMVKRAMEGWKEDIRGKAERLSEEAEFIRAETDSGEESVIEKLDISVENVINGEIRKREAVVAGQAKDFTKDAEFNEKRMEEEIQMKVKTEVEISTDNLNMKNILNDMPEANIVAVVETENLLSKEVRLFTP